jgi:signal transduction histidine kinase/DNA-binding response OmpR family regulator
MTSPLAKKSTEVRSNYPLRVTGCLLALVVHLMLFWGHAETWLWAYVIAHSLVYPNLTFLLSRTARDEYRNILLDSFAYGVCVALWGFNPLLSAMFIGGLLMTNAAAGGRKLFLYGVLALCAGSVIAGFTHGWYFRAKIDVTLSLIILFGLIAYTSSLGMLIYNVSHKLVQAKKNLESQKQELVHVSTLAEAVNSTLDINTIMQIVIRHLQHYHFEQIYITVINEEKKVLEILGTYGDTVSKEEKEYFESMQMPLQEDNPSLFVKSLLKNKILYLPNIQPGDMANASSTDRHLYETKPSRTIVYFPMSVQGRVIAGMGFINYRDVGVLSEQDLADISRYLVQVATAIRNAQLYQKARTAIVLAQQARIKAEASEEAKGNFLANMSHEIRTPMTAILGYAEALLDQGVTESEKKQFIEIIIRSGKHLLTVINDILDISKIEANRMEVEAIPVGMAELVEDLKSHLGLKAGEKGLLFSVACEYPLPVRFISDPTRLKQILFNIGNNAVKFTAQGQIKVNIGCVDGMLKFSITDSGIGISDEQSARLFSAFSQADTSTTRHYGGTGLGLYISRQLAHLLNGDLNLQSEIGNGSTFVLRIPYVAADAEYYQDAQALADGANRGLEQNAGYPLLHGKVLVADDNADNQLLIKRLLQQCGLQVWVVGNGAQALQLAAEQHFDLIILDIQMPLMGGEAVLQALRQQASPVPVLAFTANVMKQQVQRYLDIGFNDVLAKPVIRHHLFSILEHYLSADASQINGQVLVVDDNPVNLKIVVRMLQKISEGLQIRTAEHGQRALELLTEQTVDLVLLDMQMPVMDGMQTLQAIRSQGYSCHVYMLTGNTELQDIQDCISHGAEGYLFKPVDKQLLAQVVRTHLGQ